MEDTPVSHPVKNQKYWSRPLFWWSCGGYQLTALILLGFWYQGVVPLHVAVVYSLLGLGFHAWVYWHFSNGYNLRYPDPRRHTVQIVYGLSMQYLVLWLAPQISFLPLITLFLVFQFIALSGSVRLFGLCLGVTVLVVTGLSAASGDIVRVPLSTPAERGLVFTSILLMIARTGVLSMIMSQMRGQLLQSHARQRQTAQELTHTLVQLRQTQHALVRNEKLSAMGRLVVGVAHELNTPIGNALLVSSTLLDANRQLQQHLNDNSLQRKTLTEFALRNQESAQLLMRSMEAAAQLINDFKQVAATPDSENYCHFHLQHELTLVVNAMRAQIDNSGHTLVLDLPADITMDGYPRLLQTVVGHLISNALVHAFTDRQGGTMRLSATLSDANRVVLHFSDNGVGIPPENIDKIFDPFFTTRMGRGGTGLGLSIVYNLVTGLLDGTIEVDSQDGLSVRLTLPRHAPK